MSITIANLVKVKEIRTKILITLGLLLCFRIGFFVPLPGVELSKFYNDDGTGGNSLFKLMGVLTGSNLSLPCLFSLGVMPYISSSIIFSLLTKVVPSLEALSKEGASGQRKINQYTRLATIPICILQSFFIIVGTISPSQGTAKPWVDAQLWGDHKLLYIPLVIISLTAGTLFVMWIGEQITEHGIGNGVSILIMAGIVSGLYPAFTQAFSGEMDAETWQTLLMFAGAWIVAVIAVVFMTKAQRRIPIQQAKQTRGRSVYGGQQHFLPLKVNSAGVMPIIFASALLLIPSFIAKSLGWTELETAFTYGRGFWYVATFAGLIFFFSFFWTSLMFQPNDLANNLKEHGSFIPGIRPGKNTATFLEETMWRITLAGAAFLALVAVFPTLVAGAFPELGGQTVLLYFMSGTSILIVVSVALDMVEKLNAMLIMRNYEGFMKDTGGAGTASPAGGAAGGGAGGGGGWGRRG